MNNRTASCWRRINTTVWFQRFHNMATWKSLQFERYSRASSSPSCIPSLCWGCVSAYCQCWQSGTDTPLPHQRCVSSRDGSYSHLSEASHHLSGLFHVQKQMISRPLPKVISTTCQSLVHLNTAESLESEYLCTVSAWPKVELKATLY